MKCYRPGGCGPYEQTPCNECPYSKPQGSLRTIGVNGSLPLPIGVTRGKMKEEGHQ